MFKNPHALPLILTVIATLCFIAGSSRFGFLPKNIADFAGIALILSAGVCWALVGWGKSKRDGS